MTDFFKDIEGFEGLYRINKNRKIFDIRNQSYLKPSYEYGCNIYCLIKNNQNNYFDIEVLLDKYFPVVKPVVRPVIRVKDKAYYTFEEAADDLRMTVKTVKSRAKSIKFPEYIFL